MADALPQAVDDLRRERSTQRTPTWAIDTALPDLAALNLKLRPASRPDHPHPRREGGRRQRCRRYSTARPGCHARPSRTSPSGSPAGPGGSRKRERHFGGHRGRAGRPRPSRSRAATGSIPKEQDATALRRDGSAGVHNDVPRGIYDCARMDVRAQVRGDVARRSGWRRRRRDADVESHPCDETLESQRPWEAPFLTLRNTGVSQS